MSELLHEVRWGRAQSSAALIPNCRLETVPDAACFVSLDDPDALVALVEDFVPAITEAM